MSAGLWLYFTVVFGVVALPGMDMAFVLGSALAGGRRTGMAAVGGIVAGGVCHMLMGALGCAMLLALWPALFDVLLAAGAAYLAWLGYALLRHGAGGALTAAGAADPAPAFRRALYTSLLNPKAYLFMLAVFPQFVRPAAGPLWLQTMALGLITAGVQAGVYGTVAVAGGGAAGWLRDRPRAGAAAGRLAGAALLLIAALTAGQLRSYSAWS